MASLGSDPLAPAACSSSRPSSDLREAVSWEIHSLISLLMVDLSRVPSSSIALAGLAVALDFSLALCVGNSISVSIPALDEDLLD